MMDYSKPFPLASPSKPQQTAFAPNLSVRLICPDCRDPNPKIIEDFSAGDLVCGNCGLVLGDRIVDTRSEWRTFTNDEGDDPSRVGAATDPLMEGMEQLNTTIRFKDGGTDIARELQRAVTRSESQDPHRKLLAAFRDISSWCDQFSLPKTISDIAKQLYKRADEEKLLRGKPLDAVIAATIYIACREARVPRTFREICDRTQVSKNVVVQCFKALEQLFHLTPESSAASAGVKSVLRPEDMLARYCNHLDLPPHVQPICKDIIVAAREHGIADGRSPLSIVGGAIYFACLLLGVPRAIKDIAAQGVSEVTIKRMYRLYYTNRRKLVKDEWVKEGKVYMDRLPVETGK